MHYVTHITLLTGHIRRSHRDEVDNAAVDYARGLLTSARAQGRVDLVGPVSHHGLTVTVDGAALLAVIDAPVGPHLPGHPHRGATTPLVTMAVARKSRVGPALWSLICTHAGLQTPPARPPAPWLAVHLHSALHGYPASVDWLGDLERVIAWAWIEGDNNAASSKA